MHTGVKSPRIRTQTGPVVRLCCSSSYMEMMLKVPLYWTHWGPVSNDRPDQGGLNHSLEFELNPGDTESGPLPLLSGVQTPEAGGASSAWVS
ncbi:hypothetical protein NDU88_006492 [Pleurodeles waltl]|uniref:Uncharacterized protein n=1 Tax=Pleurodeles waltl TaxID=8319 RepID=A0AAV7ME21_PLEWA|nr:hypothetical protein NDU88_006492 [Pleurodeles waltl]